MQRRRVYYAVVKLSSDHCLRYVDIYLHDVSEVDCTSVFRLIVAITLA